MTASGMSQVYLRVCRALLVAVFVLSACGGEENEQPQARGSTAGFTTYEVASAGFSVDVPESWRITTADEVLTDSYVEEVEQARPELGRILRELARPASPLKFFAFDPTSTGGFATNMNVIVEDVPSGFTREQYFDASLAYLRRLDIPQGLEQERVVLPAGEALHLVYEQVTPGTTTNNATIQYVLFDRGTGYVLTYATLPDRANEEQDTFQRSARSFRLS